MFNNYILKIARVYRVRLRIILKFFRYFNTYIHNHHMKIYLDICFYFGIFIAVY
jgi:hypothetical protein